MTELKPSERLRVALAVNAADDGMLHVALDREMTVALIRMMENAEVLSVAREKLDAAYANYRFETDEIQRVADRVISGLAVFSYTVVCCAAIVLRGW